MQPDDQALLELGLGLRAAGYRFITVSPETHRRVNARPENAEARSLRDVFGWSRAFRASLLPRVMLELLDQAGALVRQENLLRSKVRYATLGDALFVHSAYPTVKSDAVFFGPDTYRFAALIQHTLAADKRGPIKSAVDIGCGTGVGGIVLASVLADPSTHLVLADINTQALRYARINAALAGITAADCKQSDVLGAIAGPVDIIVANPPYLLDAGARLYRSGGGVLGYDLSVRIVRESLPKLAPGGTLILYTGAPIVEGTDVFRRAIEPMLMAAGLDYRYADIDPDIFGEELECPGYGAVERIAAVSLIVQAR